MQKKKCSVTDGNEKRAKKVRDLNLDLFSGNGKLSTSVAIGDFSQSR